MFITERVKEKTEWVCNGDAPCSLVVYESGVSVYFGISGAFLGESKPLKLAGSLYGEFLIFVPAYT